MTPPSGQDEHPTPHRGRQPSGRPVSSSSTAFRLQLVLHADPVAPSVARDRFDRWLRDLAWPTGQREDLVLALSEAVTNSVEHGYGVSPSAPSADGRLVEAQAELVQAPDGARRIVLTVRDRGGWREPSATPHRGHGIRMIRAGADTVTIEGNAHGTTVTLTSAPVPPAQQRIGGADPE